jgi:ABC-type dipeptide/oligopeptide/nickel transport system permease component
MNQSPLAMPMPMLMLMLMLISRHIVSDICVALVDPRVRFGD